ncbi:one cut domain family member 2 [Pezoporus wallicus]|uniref:one cut domain family member 2 n=1 Tax=Pezoporus wallicus TaxID=35540 RepID=UPI00254B4086|nr:one cut domain family member 2 [Pezoporus wallicus]
MNAELPLEPLGPDGPILGCGCGSWSGSGSGSGSVPPRALPAGPCSLPSGSELRSELAPAPSGACEPGLGLPPGASYAALPPPPAELQPPPPGPSLPAAAFGLYAPRREAALGPGPLPGARGDLAFEPPLPSAPGAAAEEELNTREVAGRVAAELKRCSIPQAVFAQRVLRRSQGTLSDLLRNPKPWGKLKAGRETFRRMWKWLQEPEGRRVAALRLAACRRKEQEAGAARAGGAVPKRSRLVFTELQRRTLGAVFRQNRRPSKELQASISRQLGLGLPTVSNFFMNARRRSREQRHDERAAAAPAPCGRA